MTTLVASRLSRATESSQPTQTQLSLFASRPDRCRPPPRWRTSSSWKAFRPPPSPVRTKPASSGTSPSTATESTSACRRGSRPWTSTAGGQSTRTSSRLNCRRSAWTPTAGPSESASKSSTRTGMERSPSLSSWTGFPTTFRRLSRGISTPWTSLRCRTPSAGRWIASASSSADPPLTSSSASILWPCLSPESSRPASYTPSRSL
mmetsp:Transcript_11221/g.20333  ORF Transcript_11221/g.20333 Transcript_11221/m.20333 type:complete len:205 (-) Transcript_11221:441-1055(-)